MQSGAIMVNVLDQGERSRLVGTLIVFVKPVIKKVGLEKYSLFTFIKSYKCFHRGVEVILSLGFPLRQTRNLVEDGVNVRNMFGMND